MYRVYNSPHSLYQLLMENCYKKVRGAFYKKKEESWAAQGTKIEVFTQLCELNGIPLPPPESFSSEISPWMDSSCWVALYFIDYSFCYCERWNDCDNAIESVPTSVNKVFRVIMCFLFTLRNYLLSFKIANMILNRFFFNFPIGFLIIKVS